MVILMVLVMLLAEVVVVVTLPMSMAMVFVISDFRKQPRGVQTHMYAATVKSLGASSRISQKMNVGRCNCCYH